MLETKWETILKICDILRVRIRKERLYKMLRKIQLLPVYAAQKCEFHRLTNSLTQKLPLSYGKLCVV